MGWWRGLVAASAMTVVAAGCGSSGQVSSGQGGSTTTTIAPADSRSLALSVADHDAVILSTYDYRTLGQQLAGVQRIATPAFAAKFEKTDASLQKLLVQYHASAKGTVNSSKVTAFRRGRAVVELQLDQAVANTAQQAAPSTERLEPILTLIYQGGRWLLDDLVEHNPGSMPGASSAG